MRFVETNIFTKRITELLKDDEYSDLQISLIENPTAGKVIPGASGLRKLRWASGGKGKRGGMRVIYYFVVDEDTILFLHAYRKNEMEDLPQAAYQALAALVKEEFK